MANARTGAYVDDYLEYSSNLAGDLQRILSTMGELDERADGASSMVFLVAVANTTEVFNRSRGWAPVTHHIAS